MSIEKQPTIVLGVTGSVAAYKAASLVRLMVSEEWNVHVIMTQGATQFVTPLTFQTLSRNEVILDLFDKRETWMPAHIELAQKADILLVAPATANCIAKIAHGISDDALSATIIASTAPLMVAPAMNCNMWANVAVQENTQALIARGVKIIDPDQGELACGVMGSGRMPNPELFIEIIKRHLAIDCK